MTTVVLRRVFFVQLSFRRPKAFHQTVRLPKDMLCSFEPETVQICHPLCSALSKTFNWSFIVLLQKFWFFKITWTKKKKKQEKNKLSLTTRDCWKVLQAVNFIAKNTNNLSFFLDFLHHILGWTCYKNNHHKLISVIYKLLTNWLAGNRTSDCRIGVTWSRNFSLKLSCFIELWTKSWVLNLLENHRVFVWLR